MVEQLVNEITGQLNAAISNSATSFDLKAGHSFPATANGDYRIRIGTELMLVTNLVTNTLTVTRGIEGTAAVSHEADDDVVVRPTAAGMVAWLGAARRRLFSETIVGSGGVADVDIASIPGTWRNILIEMMVRSERANAFDELRMQFNGDTATNYDTESDSGYATTEQNNEQIATASPFLCFAPGSTANANLFSHLQVFIPFYASTAFDKVARTIGGDKYGTGVSTQVATRNGMVFWESTAAITRVRLFFDANDVAEGSRVALYLED